MYLLTLLTLMAVRAVCSGAAQWRQMSATDKTPYQKLAEGDKARYRQQKAELMQQQMLEQVSSAQELPASLPVYDYNSDGTCNTRI